VRHWKTEVVVNSLEMLSGRGKKEYAREAQGVAAESSSNETESGTGATLPSPAAIPSAQPQEAVLAM
jgi:hypothetical protein